ncbi:hypothetical protein Q0590_08750 [Rhodocytophaga aerolata]|uniref:Lipoprotein n=1 Tax=Rhodocytophaga aerolata TaxID=455078 RepID=A0ABT8R6F8_9BACT|nr:hypothetical protein [Rhodocytophaga aerolata]MDO1446337.1 hypothetical protein [Rhodocytophaga aerolata]
MNKIILLLLVGLLVGSCQEKQPVVDYVGTKQKLNLNDKDVGGNSIEEIKLVPHIPDSIILGRQAVFKLTTSNSKHKIVQAYFDCLIDTSSYIDTVSYNVEYCNKELALINDTVVIALKPQKTGDFVFPHTILAISKGNDGIFRFHTGTFGYKVIDK